MGVHVGCVITYPDQFQILNGNKFVCRAIDNRAGGFMIAEVARLLHENRKENSLMDYILLIRFRRKLAYEGAEMITQRLKTEHCYCNGCFVMTPPPQ